MPIITNAYTTEVEEVGHILTIQTTNESGELRTEAESYVIHHNHDIQAKGQRFLHKLLDICGIVEITDAKQFIGNSVTHQQLQELRDIDCPSQPNRRQRASVASAPTVAHIPKDHGDRFVYVISCVDTTPELCKIGIATSAEKRVRTLATSSPHPLRLELARRAGDARAVEASAHFFFAEHRRNGEWFEMPASRAIEFVNSAIDGVQA